MMLDQTNITPDRLTLFPVFHGLSDDLIQEIQRNSRVLQLEAGETLFRQFDPAQRTYLCISGQLKLFRLTRSGNEKIFRFAGPTDSLSNPITLGPERFFSLNCAAIKPSRVLSIHNKVMARVFDRCTHARTNVVNLLQERVDELLDHVELLSVDKALIRVAAWLIDDHVRSDSRNPFVLGSTKKQIAAYLALQPETFSRCLKKLRDDGIAITQGQQVDIQDFEALSSLAGRVRTAA